MMAKAITEEYLDQQLNKLAVAVANGFQGVDGRLNNVELRLDKVDARLDGMETKLDNIVYKKLDQTDSRVTKIEKHLKLKTAN